MKQSSDTYLANDTFFLGWLPLKLWIVSMVALVALGRSIVIRRKAFCYECCSMFPLNCGLVAFGTVTYASFYIHAKFDIGREAVGGLCSCHFALPSVVSKGFAQRGPLHSEKPIAGVLLFVQP